MNSASFQAQPPGACDGSAFPNEDRKLSKYDPQGIGEQTAIELFDGGHTTNRVGTLEFLHKHLKPSDQQGAAREDSEGQ